MPQPFEVDVVHEGSSLLGPILIGLGAVVAAVLTAVTANWRHRKQLANDRVLQAEQLKSDRQLRREELEHDRAMRRRENVRVVLDEVLTNERVLRHASDDFFEALDGAEANRVQLEVDGVLVDDDQRDAIYLEALRAEVRLQGLLAESHYDSVKLRVRMGGHAVVTSHEVIGDFINERLDAVDTDRWPVRTQAEKEADREAAEQISDAQTEFLVACSKWHTSDV